MENINLFTSPVSTGNMQKHLNEEIKDHATYHRFIQGIRKRVVHTINEVMKVHSEWDFSSIDLSSLIKEKVHEITSTEPIGVCLLCDRPVIDKGKLYACKDETKCDFKIWKTQFGRNIELEHAHSILEKRTTPLLEFFSKPKNKHYSAYIVWNEDKNELNLAFPERIKRPTIRYDDCPSIWELLK